MKIHESAFIHPSAALYGDLEIGEGSSVWPSAAIRADFNSIRIARMSSVQDTAVLHSTPTCPVIIGSYVTVGHGAVVHGATIEDYVLVGIRAVVLDGAKVGAGSFIAAGAVIRDGMVIPPDSFVSGSPAAFKPARPGTREQIRAGAISYHLLSRRYLEGKEIFPLNELIERMKEWESSGRE